MRSIFRVGARRPAPFPHPKNFSLRSKFFDLPTRGRLLDYKHRQRLRAVRAELQRLLDVAGA